MATTDTPQFLGFLDALEKDRKLPQGILSAVMKVESNGNPSAVSDKGAQGAFQFMPATAKEYSVNTADPYDSARGAADLLMDAGKMYQGNWDAALAHYNGGVAPARSVQKTGSTSVKETSDYVKKVRANMPAQSSPARSIEQQKKDLADKIVEAKRVGFTDEEILSNVINHPAFGEEIANAASKLPPSKVISVLGGKTLEDAMFQDEKKEEVSNLTPAERVSKGADVGATEVGEGIKQAAARIGLNLTPEIKPSESFLGRTFVDPIRRIGAVFSTPSNEMDAIRANQVKQIAERERENRALLDTPEGKIGNIIGDVGSQAAVQGIATLAGAPLVAGAQKVAQAGIPIISKLAKPASYALESVANPKSMTQMGLNSAAMTAATTPTESLSDTALIAGVGGATGAVLGKALAAPLKKQAADVRDLQDVGVKLTLGQSLGPWGQALEETMTGSVPGIAAARLRSQQSFRNAVFDEVLPPGADRKLLSGLDGHDAYQTVKSAYNQAFDDVLSGISVRPNPSSTTRLQTIINDIPNRGLDAEDRDQISRLVTKGFDRARVPGQADLSAESVQSIVSDLRRQAFDNGKSLVAAERRKGEVMSDVADEIENWLEHSLGRDQATRYQAIRSQYGKFKVVENAIDRSNSSANGAFTPQQLASAIKSKDKAAWRTGSGRLQQLAETGQRVVGNNIPDSGTARRLAPYIFGGGLGGVYGGFQDDPGGGTLKGLAAAGAGGMLYSRPGQAIAKFMLSRRMHPAQAQVGAALSPALARYLSERYKKEEQFQ